MTSQSANPLPIIGHKEEESCGEEEIQTRKKDKKDRGVFLEDVLKKLLLNIVS